MTEQQTTELIKHYKLGLEEQFKSLDADIKLFRDAYNFLDQRLIYQTIKSDLWNINQSRESLKQFHSEYEHVHPLEKYIVDRGVILNEHIDLYYSRDEAEQNRSKERNSIIESGIYECIRNMKK